MFNALLCLLSLFAADAPAGEDPALKAPPVILQPGPEYANSTRIFQGIPGIERTVKGRLYATWYGGGETEGPDNYVMLARSDNDGKTWSAPFLIIDPPDKTRAFDPCLWIDPDGRLWLFWAQAWEFWDGRAGVWAIVSENPDFPNPDWSEPRRLCNGVMMNKPTVLSTGEWLLPVAVWSLPPKESDYVFDLNDRSGSNVFCSTDHGKSWRFWGQAQVPERRCDEHMIVELLDGRLWMLVRTEYGVGESFSSDRGRTWTPGKPSKSVTHIPHARFFIRRLASGNLLLVKHDPPDKKTRSHLKAFLSKDDGKTWEGGLQISKRTSVSYPDGVQALDGLIYLIYDHSRHGEKQILMTTFTEEDILAQKDASGKVRRAEQVNQATGQKAS